ncbi:MAG: hypothetical protein ACRD68_17150, partial [Pyrinomonadaceae bacterium]
VIDLPLTASSYAVKGFVERLKDSPHVSVGSVGKGDRRRARERAKVEKDYHVILVQLDENSPGRGAGGPIDLSNLMVRYYVFAPGEATLKVQGQVPMRPYRGTATVGGVRLPVPTPRVNVPFEYIVEQAGRDAAERVMAAFNLRLPPDRY